MNYVGGRDICGVCKSIASQDNIVPCAANRCVSSEEGMIHKSCAIRIRRGDFVCKACILANAPCEGNTSSSESSDSEVVIEHKGIKVGMPLHGGNRQEIYPASDVCFSKHVLADGGVEIRRHALSKVIAMQSH